MLTSSRLLLVSKYNGGEWNFVYGAQSTENVETQQQYFGSTNKLSLSSIVLELQPNSQWRIS